jgi:uncharacterized membrane protein YgcG
MLSILRGGLLGAAVAAAINAIVFFIAKAVDAMPETVIVSSGQPITLAPVVMASIVPAVMATLVFWALARFTQSPKKIFIGVAVVVFVATLGGPFSIPDVPTSMIVALEIMHLVAAIAITFGLVMSYTPQQS